MVRIDKWLAWILASSIASISLPVTAEPIPDPITPPTEPCIENFDSVTAPALPYGWTAKNLIAGDCTLWVTTTIEPDSPPNDGFIPDQAGISDKTLVSWELALASDTGVVDFRNNFKLDSDGGIFRDGAVLEVSSPNIKSGAFVDVTDPEVGGVFIWGGYTGIIDT